MDEQMLDDQLEPMYSSFVPIQDVGWKTFRERWTIEKGGREIRAGSAKWWFILDNNILWLLLMSVFVFIDINVINIYHNNELIISLIILIGLMINSNNCNCNTNCDFIKIIKIVF